MWFDLIVGFIVDLIASILEGITSLGSKRKKKK
jgi:uncharacterized membrane protein